jgi:hypothetical protein
MTIVEQKLLSVEVVVGQAVDFAYCSIVLRDFVLQRNIGNQAVVAIVDRNLEFVNRVTRRVMGWGTSQ